MLDPPDPTAPPGSLRGITEGHLSTGALEDATTDQLALALLERIRSSQPPPSFSTRQLLGALDLELEPWACVHENRRSAKWICDLFHAYTRSPEHLPPLADSVVVELGCGSANPLSLLLVFLLLGAKRGIAVDLDQVADHRLASRALSRIASYMLTDPGSITGNMSPSRPEVVERLSAFDLSLLWQGDSAGVDWNRLALRHESAEALSLDDDEADLVLSNSFLEHVSSVDTAIAEMARITRSGGYGVHQIDGIDHVHYAESDHHPLDFLRVDSSETLVGECNRVRPLDYADIFDRHGFDVLQIHEDHRIPIGEDVRNSFVEPYRSMPEKTLEVIGAAYNVRRR